ncbi:MAG: outer membrane lipoprotein carrier protein LolA [Muribaculaceae bacterium]
MIRINRIAIMLTAVLMPLLAMADVTADALAEISAASKQMQSFECNFVQTKTLKLLGDKMISKGRLSYRQPDKLRWEYTSPYSYTFIINGGKVQINKGGRNDVIDADKNKVFKEVARIMLNSVVGKSLTDSHEFAATVQSTADIHVVTLLPQKKDMKHMFSKIVLRYDRRQKMVVGVEMHERKGDSTVIEMTNVVKDKTIADSVFTVK